jgi:F0F1-type ATP synthase membrane subunit b/b'
MIRPQGTSSSVQATRSRLAIATTLAVAHFSVATAYASGGEGGPHGSIADISGPWINFIVYVALMTALVRKPIKNGWASRRERIAEEVAAATSEMKAAERELAAVEAITKNIGQEQERARLDIIKQGELECLSIASASHEKAARIKSQVVELLEGESRSAQASFRAALVAQAVELSRARFQGGEFASRQAAYVDAAVDRAKKLVR